MVNERETDLMDRTRRQEEDAAKKMDDMKPANPNDRLITRELSSLRKLKETQYRDTGHQNPLENNRFSVIGSTKDFSRIKNSKKAKEDKEKQEKIDALNAEKITGAASVPTFKSKKSTAAMQFALKKKEGDKKSTGKNDGFDRMNAENYRSVYLRRKRTQWEATHVGGKMTPEQMKLKLAAEKREQERETFLRVRARDLLTEIYWWRSQYGMGVYENYYVSGQIAALEQEVNAIDVRYWP